MDIDRLRRISDVLDVALTRDPSDWPALLDDACRGDAELRRDVEARLARVHSAERFLNRPPVGAVDALIAESNGTTSQPREGQRLGAYRVIRELGRGGMSRVYLAERADGQFERQVALKLLRPGLDSEIDQQRFRVERQILASLDHPHIARLLDGGMTDDGASYLVMEYVEGSALDTYCAERQLSMHERLTLFVTVVQAVEFAHRNLVVHRDLKPSNILVSANGTVKLLDFGLAKLVQPTESLSNPATRTGHRWMTPQYAAPEQVQGGTISTLTDVYQLGAVLYELLAGQGPFASYGRELFDLECAIVDTEPPVPSVAANNRSLRGDLDAIVMKAIAKEPERRYATVAAFREDLQRYLDGRAVVARPESAAYRARKFVRRNRAGVTAAVATALALIGATVFSASQAREARRQRDVAQAQVRRQNAMAEVQAVLATDARGPDGHALSLAERIDNAERALLGRFGDEPALVSEVLTELAQRLYENSNELAAERRVLARAAALATNANLAPQFALAECQRAYSFVYDDMVDSARVALAAARARLAQHHGSVDAVVESTCLAAEGQVLVASGSANLAIVPLRRAAALVELAERGGRLGRLNDLATALRAAGHTREATDYQRRIVAEMDSTGYHGSDEFPNAVGYLASALWELGELTEVDSILRGIVRTDEAMYGVGNTQPMLSYMYGLGKLRLGVLDSADVWFTRAMRDTSAASPVRAIYLPAGLTQLRIEQGRLASARESYATLPTGTHTRRVVAALLGARLRSASGDTRGAMRMLDTSLESLMGDRPNPPANMAVAFTTAAEWHLAAGDVQASDSLARLAYAAAAQDSIAIRQSAYVGSASLVRARALLALGDTTGARDVARRAMVALENGYGVASARARVGKTFVDSLFSRIAP